MTYVTQDRGRLLATITLVALGVVLILILMAGQLGEAQQTGPTYKVLYTFTGGADGAAPQSGLAADPARNLLVGTTSGGGATGNGTVFGVSLAGQESVLYSFTGTPDGSSSYAGLIQDPAGNLYGTTSMGGNLSGCGGDGCGVAFELSPSGQETVLYTFTGEADGARPYGSLFRDPAGNLYGTTGWGGDMNCSAFGFSGCGVVFKLTP